MILYINDDLIRREYLEKRGAYRFISESPMHIGKDGKDRNQTIITLSESDTDRILDETYAHRIITVPNKKGGYRASIQLFRKKKSDVCSPIIIAAIPFKGVLSPMAESKEYRIHRAFIANSKEPLTCGKYDVLCGEPQLFYKIAYLVITPNMRVFDPKDGDPASIQIDVPSYHFQHKGNVRETIQETYSIILTRAPEKEINDGAGILCEQNVTRVISPPIDANAIRRRRLFPIYRPVAKKDKPKNENKK